MPTQFISLEGEKEVPPGVAGWNWGAFFLTWIWGICNGTLLSLLSLIPGIHFIMMFVLGFKGNEWAWKNKEWESVEQFHHVQRKWAAWAIGIWLCIVALCIIIPVGILGWGISTEMPQIKNMIADFEPQRKYCNYALSAAERDPRYSSLLGGRLQVCGPSEAKVNENGYIDVAVPVRAAKGEGHLYIRTHQEGNVVNLESAELELKDLERMPIKTTAAENEIRDIESRITNLVTATRIRNEFKQREPKGKEEAEELYHSTMRRIEDDSRVKEMLGTEIKTRVEHAKLNLEGPGGEAEVTVLAEGKNRSATIIIRFLRTLGRWELTEAKFESAGQTLQF